MVLSIYKLIRERAIEWEFSTRRQGCSILKGACWNWTISGCRVLLSVNCVWVYWTLLQGFITSDNKRLYKCINHINSVNSLCLLRRLQKQMPQIHQSHLHRLHWIQIYFLIISENKFGLLFTRNFLPVLFSVSTHSRSPVQEFSPTDTNISNTKPTLRTALTFWWNAIQIQKFPYIIRKWVSQ